MMATNELAAPIQFSGLVVVVIVISVVIAVVIAVAPALASYLFKFLMAPVGLAAIFAMALAGDTQLFFSFMDAPFATLMLIGAGGRRRRHQPRDGQEGNA